MTPGNTTKERRGIGAWLEGLSTDPRLTFIHPLISLFNRPENSPGGLGLENSGITIPQYLLDHQYVVPLAEYLEVGNWSKKTEMFVHIAEVTATVEKDYGMRAPMPSVIPLTHKFWERWLEKGQKFDEEAKTPLANVINQVKRSSDTGKVVIRHLDDDGQNGNVGARSYPGVVTVEDAIEKIQAQYRFFAQPPLNWQDKGHEVEVCVGLYPHADPTAFQTISKNGVEILSSGQPPIGVVATTSQNGEKITVKIVIGDNLAAQEKPGVCDAHFFTFADPDRSGKDSLIRSKPPKYGAREHIIQDRNGQLLETIKLPAHMHNRPIRLDETEIIRAALVAAVGAKKLGHDVKVEGALNHDGFVEINSLAKFEEPKTEMIGSFELAYQVLGVIKNLDDAKALANIPTSTVQLAPTIILSDQLKNSVGVDNALEIIIQTLKDKEQAVEGEKAKQHWRNALILTTGTSLSHHLDGFLNLEVKHYLAEKIPSVLPGDILAFEEGRNPGDIWIRNLHLSGDGIFIIAPEHWPKTPPAKIIGNKAFNHREVVSRNNLKSPPYIVLTNEAFLNILEENGVKEHYDKLLSGNGHTPIKEIFTTIRENLKHIPPEIWDDVVRLLKRKVGNFHTVRFLARSNSTVEDMGPSKRYAGAFETYNNLSLQPENNQVALDEAGQPSNLAGGILSVMSSMFTDELAENFEQMSPIDRKKILANWAMPVKIDKQINAIVSGVAVAQDPDTGNKDFLTVEAQAGIGGVVDGAKAGRPILTAKADRQTMQLTSLTVKYADQEMSIKLNSVKELATHFPEELNEDFIISIMNAVAKIHQVSGKMGLEWAIDHEENQEPQLWFNQAR